MSEYRSDVNMWKRTDYKTGCTVLGSLKFAGEGLRKTSQERVARWSTVIPPPSLAANGLVPTYVSGEISHYECLTTCSLHDNVSCIHTHRHTVSTELKRGVQVS